MAQIMMQQKQAPLRLIYNKGALASAYTNGTRTALYVWINRFYHKE